MHFVNLIRARVGVWLVVILGLLTAGCGGGVGFTSASKGKSQDAKPKLERKPKPRPEPEPQVEPYSSLTWRWVCDDSEATEPVSEPEGSVVDEAFWDHATETEDTADGTSIIVDGTGPHEFPREELEGTPITIRGQLCPLPEGSRDIVFIIDVSGSMNDNDPPNGNTCGRLQAVEQVIASVASDTTMFSLVTFDDGVRVGSTGLFPTQGELFDDAAPGGKISDVLCAAKLGTNYNAALSKAAELLALGRAEATKEIYFVSDGQPNVGQDGILLAQMLKTTGVLAEGSQAAVTIATVMLGGTDTVLEQSIASRSQGTPLHAYVADTKDLAKVLAKLADNEIVGSELKYRPIGSLDWTSVNLLDHLQGMEFSLPPMTVDFDAVPLGLEVFFVYSDKYGNSYESEGRLLWTAGASLGKPWPGGD